MKEDLEKILANLRDAGCGETDRQSAERIYRSGDTDALIRHLRKCRCSLMEELHETQRKVDCLDYLIRQTAKTKTTL